MCSHATQYEEAHEWFERCGVHGRPSQRARFGLMMNAAASRSCAISTGAPIAKKRRIPDGTPASVAFVEGLRRSWRSTTPPTPAPTTDAVIIDPVRPALAVNATIEARIDSVAKVNPPNQRGTDDMEAHPFSPRHPTTSRSDERGAGSAGHSTSSRYVVCLACAVPA